MTLQKIVKSILGYRKTINSQKNSSREKDFCKEWFAHAIARTAGADDSNNNNTHTPKFPTIG